MRAMNLRTVGIVTLLAVVPVGLASCGSDSTSTSTTASTTTAKEVTTTEKETTTTAASVGGDTTTTVSGTSFGDALPPLEAELAAAAGDACALSKVFDKLDAAGNPTTTDEVKAGTDFVVKLFNAIADSAPATMSAEATAIRDAASKFEGDAAGVDYDPAKISGATDFSPAALAGLQKFKELTKGC